MGGSCQELVERTDETVCMRTEVPHEKEAIKEKLMNLIKKKDRKTATVEKKDSSGGLRCSE
jgi:hypothetical protein